MGVHIPSPFCPACSTADESLDHLFLHCTTTNFVMAYLRAKWSKFPDLNRCRNIEELVVGGSDQTWSEEDKIKYVVMIRAFLWIIWCNRNAVRFQGKIKTAPILGSKVLLTSSLWLRTRSKLHREDICCFCFAVCFASSLLLLYILASR
ncbi:hypothetical protein LXL04_026859 [Taraxacum kok-saghyz]